MGKQNKELLENIRKHEQKKRKKQIKISSIRRN